MSFKDTEDDDRKHYKYLKSTLTLITIGLVGAPVSLLLGGLPLAVAGAICSLIAFIRLNKIGAKNCEKGSLDRRLYFQSIVAIGFSVVAIAINAYASVVMISSIMDAINSNTLDSYIDSKLGHATDNSSKSIWDK